MSIYGSMWLKNNCIVLYGLICQSTAFRSMIDGVKACMIRGGAAAGECTITINYRVIKADSEFRYRSVRCQGVLLKVQGDCSRQGSNPERLLVGSQIPSTLHCIVCCCVWAPCQLIHSSPNLALLTLNFSHRMISLIKSSWDRWKKLRPFAMAVKTRRFWL